MSDDESAGEEIQLIKQVNVFRRKFNYALITSFFVSLSDGFFHRLNNFAITD